MSSDSGRNAFLREPCGLSRSDLLGVTPASAAAWSRRVGADWTDYPKLRSVFEGPHSIIDPSLLNAIAFALQVSGRYRVPRESGMERCGELVHADELDGLAVVLVFRIERVNRGDGRRVPVEASMLDICRSSTALEGCRSRFAALPRENNLLMGPF